MYINNHELKWQKKGIVYDTIGILQIKENSLWIEKQIKKID